VPEGRDPRARAPLRGLLFVDAVPQALGEGEIAVYLRGAPLDAGPRHLDLKAASREHAEQWRATFVDWIGALNLQNASLYWWAYTSTAKNMLSSPLGENSFGCLALQSFLEKTQAQRVLVVGASAAQRSALHAFVEQERIGWQVTGGRARLPVLEPLVRLFWQFLRILFLRLLGGLRVRSQQTPGAVLFTYADRGFRDGADAFFGFLAQRLAERSPPVPAVHVAFVQAPYRDVLPRLEAATRAGYVPLFGVLTPSDLLWGLWISLLAWRRAAKHEAPRLGRIPGNALLRAALRWDIGRGGYFYNVVVYRAMRRLLARWSPAWLLYPYENKALEKMLLIAARDQSPECRVVGFQHTSITRRHATFLFAPGEAAATPLPDRIVTVGEVTREYLEAEGRYPPGIFATGCALRQQSGPLLERRARDDGKLRLLLALSSSRQELVESIAACRRAFDGDHDVQIGVRPHPEFPLSLLPPELGEWVAARTTDLSGTALSANLEWCDALVYVSSTVALEALGRGRPVINLEISDWINPDPILHPVEFHWTAKSPSALADAARRVAALDAAQYEQSRKAALLYVKRYLKEPRPEALDAFLPGVARGT
jgi:hypothetical protein